MKRIVKSTGVVVAAAALGLGLAACSGTSTDSGSETASSSMVGGDPGTYTPIFLDPATAGTTQDMVVGQNGIVQIDDANSVGATPSGIIEVTMEDGKFGFKAMAEGSVKVVVDSPAGEYTFDLNVVKQ